MNIENKDAIKQIFTTVKVEELYKLLCELPPDYRIWLGKFTSYRPKRNENEEERALSELKLQDIASYVIKIKKWSWEAHLQVGKNVYFDVLSKTAFTHELKKAISEMSPLQHLFNDLAQA